MKNIFDAEVVRELISRIEKLQAGDQPKWGKMSADQMLAHCNVTYAKTFHPEQFKKPAFFLKILLKSVVKRMVSGEKPYPKNSSTGPEFIRNGQYNFEKEKAELIAFVRKTQELGFDFFNGKENISFGKMRGEEWNNMFYKHLDHHLKQFGL